MDIPSRFEQSMQRVLATATAQRSAPLRLAVAYSGGLDSAVLLHLCNVYASTHQLFVMGLHVHHGLSPNADQWLHQSQTRCAELSIPFDSAHVQLGSTGDHGIEATARAKRYAALGDLCVRHQIDVLITAHHQDDQAETMLLQLLRGCGVAGLCGMQRCNHAPDMLGSDSLLLARPLLDCTRQELVQYVHAHGLKHVEDESNADSRYARNALRLNVMPLLEQYFPGYQARFARTALHAQSNLALIEELAQQDFEACRVNPNIGHLDANRLECLPDARIDNVLRYWITLHHMQMPSTARLAEMRKQLLHARDDAQVCVRHGDIELHRYRQQLNIARRFEMSEQVLGFRWQGEASMQFAGFGGALHFDPVVPGQHGINRFWLISQQLELRPRQGGERLKLAANRPTRDMKSHYQSLGIPYWQRERLPFVFVGNALLYASGVGVHGPYLEAGDECVNLRWVAD